MITEKDINLLLEAVTKGQSDPKEIRFLAYCGEHNRIETFTGAQDNRCKRELFRKWGMTI